MTFRVDYVSMGNAITPTMTGTERMRWSHPVIVGMTALPTGIMCAVMYLAMLHPGRYLPRNYTARNYIFDSSKLVMRAVPLWVLLINVIQMPETDSWLRVIS